MSPLHLSGTLYLASDIHLGPSIMRTNQAFYRFLEHVEHEADALILAGDIFNVWFGDDVALKSSQVKSSHVQTNQDKPSQAWLKQALNAFIECAKHVPIYFIHGNRDFLMGHQLCQALGVHLLPPQSLIQSDAGLLYVCHGDEFCTDDLRYMALRRKLRNPQIQALFLSLPRVLREAIARYARNMSQRAQAKQAQHIKQMEQAEQGKLSSSAIGAEPSQTAAELRYYDVNEQAIEEALRALAPSLGQMPDLMIHGHTHRPALHQLPTLGIPRIVLPDWDYDHQPEQARGGFLKVEKKSVSLLPWENDTLTPIHLSL